ncbi:TauD/TfdA family dioxygenase [Kitasatospora indigofera]|uniref:TauD/TfdA family dioxygenase n=1 Tax=Kitasatospora indigofera TaxID=67307 RepID=UPI0036AC0775
MTNHQTPPPARPAGPGPRSVAGHGSEPPTTALGHARVTVAPQAAHRLAATCTTAMDGHRWNLADTVLARRELTAEPRLVTALATAMRRTGHLTADLPPDLDDHQLRLAASAVLAAFGRPFNSIDDGTGSLWIGGESNAGRDAASFGGLGAQGLHQDAPNVERMPDFTALLFLRPDPAGGGASLTGDLHAAAAELSAADHHELKLPLCSEGRAEHLRGVGAPRLPFPVLQDTAHGLQIRWAAKLLTDPRNTEHLPVLHRFAQALERHTTVTHAARGQLLIIDQHRTAHGRQALGDQRPWPDGTRRLIVQAKAAFEQSAPATNAGSRR